MPTQKYLVVLVVMKTGIAIHPLLSVSDLLTRGSDDEEDETAELLRELEKIKKERADKQAQEVYGSGSSRMLRAANLGQRSG